MADTTYIKVNAKIKVRKDTAKNWAIANPILEDGEPAHIIDENNRVVGTKIGDGATAWNDLPEVALGSGGSSIDELIMGSDNLAYNTDYVFNSTSYVAALISADGSIASVFPNILEGTTVRKWRIGALKPTIIYSFRGGIRTKPGNIHYNESVDVEYNTDTYEYTVKVLDVSDTYDPTSSRAQSGKAVAEAISNIKDIAPEQTTFFDCFTSPNLLDVSSAKNGLLHVNGRIYTPEMGDYKNYWYYDTPIYVQEGDVLSVQMIKEHVQRSSFTSDAIFARVTAYDSDGAVLESSGSIHTGAAPCYFYTVPAGVSYVKVTLNYSDNTQYADIMVTKNATGVLPYEPYGQFAYIKRNCILVDQNYDAASELPQSGKAVAQAISNIGGSDITIDQTFDPASENAQSGVAVKQALATVENITPEQTTFFDYRPSVNLLDVSTEQVGLLHTTGKVFTPDDGNYATYRYYERPIYVDEGDVLSIQFINNSGVQCSSFDETAFFVRVVAYDDNDNVLSTLGATHTTAAPIRFYTVPSGVSYVKVTLSYNLTNIMVIANATGVLPYEPYGQTAYINNDYISVDQVYNSISELPQSGKAVHEAIISVKSALSFSNDLKAQSKIEPILGEYGGNDAVYKIDNLDETFKIAFDFKVNDNVNIAGDGETILTLIGNNTKTVKTVKSAPQILAVKDNGSEYTANSQSIGYTSGFNICGTNKLRDATFQKPIVGDTAFAIWFKGKFSETTEFPTAEEITERSTWLSQNADAKIIFTNDEFVVSGITDAGGDISVSVFDSEGRYKTLSVFYEDLKTAIGEYFDFKIMSLSSRKTTEDLLQFGTINLVSYYYQQTDKTSTTLAYNYDSFPVLIPLAIDESLHTVEIIGNEGLVYVSVDGEMVKYTDVIESVYIGGTADSNGKVTCYNLEVCNGNIGDAIISSTYGVISSRTPRLIGVMQHLVEDKYEGQELSQSYYSSISRLKDIFRMFENRSYTVLGLDDVCQWAVGRKKIPPRSVFFLCTTNVTYKQFLSNLMSRTVWTKDDIPIIIGSIIARDGDNSSVDSDILFKQVMSARSIGATYITHLYDHDVMPNYKNSMILQQELYKLIRLCIDCGIDTRMYSYGWSCSSINYFNMLSLNGFLGSMGESANYSKINNNARNPYHICRMNISDAYDYDDLDALLI